MIKLPENLFIISTINSADSGVSYIDPSLKRRFFQMAFDEKGNLYGFQRYYETLQKIVEIKGLDLKYKFDEDRIIKSEWTIEREIGTESSFQDIVEINKTIIDPQKLIPTNIFSGTMDALEYRIKIASHLIQNIYGNSENKIYDKKTLLGVLKNSVNKTKEEYLGVITDEKVKNVVNGIMKSKDISKP